jgi:hypothetical protein
VTLRLYFIFEGFSIFEDMFSSHILRQESSNPSTLSYETHPLFDHIYCHSNQLVQETGTGRPSRISNFVLVFGFTIGRT